jgi:hypothetical protein
VFGFQTCLSFLTSNPMSKLPPYLYSESVNQSLLGNVLRVGICAPLSSDPLMNPLFWGISTCLGLISLTTILRKSAMMGDVSVMIILLVGLMVYPGTLEHYAVLQIVVLFELLRIVGHLHRGEWIGTCLVICVFAFVNMKGGGLVFWGFLSSWVTFVYLALTDPKRTLKLG